MIEILRTNSENPDFAQLVMLLDAHLWEQYPETQAEYDTYNIIETNNTVIIAYNENIAVGCGCFKKLDDENVEIKRMYVKPESRGLGVSHLILAELEQWAKELGFKAALLETLYKQSAAISLYQKRGFKIIQNYGPYVGLDKSICMKKEL
ncbi:GNAT family N-acetyltransferase [Emticicia sp. SJ17W-69]|uniref:GNAT family N-acetyltransferase n=1 Tax=Emticicia sp. SJ17W-69 TaxID=3421657 RepID=UPI003EB8386B